MAFIGGLISGAAEGVASRHQEKRKFEQEQKLQDTRIQGESLEKMKQERLKTQLELIMKGSGPWSQKSVQIKQAMALSGMKPKDIDDFVGSMAPVGAVHDAAQAQGLTDVPSGPNVSAGSPARAVDPKEFGRHLGTAIGEHQLRGGDPKELDLAPHIGTLLGHLSAPAPQGQAQSQASFGDPGDLSSPPPPSQVPPGGAQGSASPAPTPQDQGPQVSLGELSGNFSEGEFSSPAQPNYQDPGADSKYPQGFNRPFSGPLPDNTKNAVLDKDGRVSLKPQGTVWAEGVRDIGGSFGVRRNWRKPNPGEATSSASNVDSNVSYGTPGGEMAPAIQGNGQLGIGAIPSIPASPIEGGAPPSDPNASVTQTPPTPQGGSGPSEESPQESPQQFSDRLNSGPSSAKSPPTPSSPVPARDPQYTAPLVQYQRELDEARATAGSARDVAKIKAQNEERLKLEQGRIDLIQKMQGTSGQGRPQHSYITEGTNGPSQHIDAGKPGGYVSGADIDEEFEHGGDNATPINHDPNALYMRRTFDASGSGSEYHKVANFKGYGPVRQAPDGTFVKDILSKTGGVLGQIQVPAPSAQQTRQTSREQSVIDPNTGERIKQTLNSTSGPQPSASGASEADLRAIGAPSAPPPPPNTRTPYSNPPAPGAQGAQGRPVSGLGQIPQRPTPASQVPPGVSAMADLWQNDPTTAKMMMANYPRNSPQKIQIQREVERRLAAGEGPVPVFLGTSARNQVQQAKLMAPEIDQTAKDIARLQDKLGPVMGRWNEFLAGSVGTGDHEFQKLRSDLSLIKSKVSQIHFGTAAGVQAVERFDKIMNAGKMDAPTLLAGISSLSQILKLYGSLNVTSGKAMQEGGAGATPTTQVPSQGSSGGYQAGHVYGGMVFSGGDPNKAENWKKR